jgi:hypothetical protein
MFPVESAWAVNKSFDEFASRCETTLLEIFNKSGSDGVDYKAWLYQVAETIDQKVAMLHQEPLYITADYLAIDMADPQSRSIETAYLGLSASRKWNEAKGA